jgi:hypothetical protein
MKLKACPKCGSRNIAQGTLGEGVLTGYVNKDVCKDCGFQGMPLIFDSEEDHKKFLEGLSKDKEDKESKSEQKAVEPVKLTEKEKELYEFLKEPTEKKTSKPLTQKRPFGLIILVFITIFYAIALAITIVSYPLVFINPGIKTLFWIYGGVFLLVAIIAIIAIPYGFLKGKEWAYTLAGTLFILALPIGLFFLYYLTRHHVKAHFGRT